MNSIGLKIGLDLVDKGLVPDGIIRANIRRLLKQRLYEERSATVEQEQQRKNALIAELRKSLVAIETTKANEQHYEVPADFYGYVLGPRRKYSCAFYDLQDHQMSLAQAEERMLALTCQRAGVQDGEQILELGCGWGSLTLYIAEHFPNVKITGVSNSHSQRQYILAQAKQRQLNNVEIITKDINNLDLSDRERFDRAVSVEMFEHVRNYEFLLGRLSGWLKPKARLFVHIFTHHRYAYPFEIRDSSDWMAKYFFSGGLMPSDDLLLYFQQHFSIVDHWKVDGRHYERTSNDWLKGMDANQAAIWPVLEATYPGEARVWWNRWRVFFMACAELWGYGGGEEWLVSHYLFEKA